MLDIDGRAEGDDVSNSDVSGCEVHARGVDCWDREV